MTHETGHRRLLSEIEIRPIYHRLPDRIRAHATICFIALILYRVTRTRLAATMSPERALSMPHISKAHTEILAALAIKIPTPKTQLTLL